MVAVVFVPVVAGLDAAAVAAVVFVPVVVIVAGCS
jgi:hypothetical protein